MSQGPVYRPMAEPLQLAALELADLARLGDDLQHLIAELGLLPGARRDVVLVRAQGADLLCQRLEGMAAFMRALAGASPADACIDVHAAVMDLTLAEQARRLAGPQPHRPAPEEGELMLFGE